MSEGGLGSSSLDHPHEKQWYNAWKTTIELLKKVCHCGTTFSKIIIKIILII